MRIRRCAVPEKSARIEIESFIVVYQMYKNGVDDVGIILIRIRSFILWCIAGNVIEMPENAVVIKEP